MLDNWTKRVGQVAICSFVSIISTFLLIVWVSFAIAAPQIPGVELGPNHTQQGSTGQTIIYNHVVTNTGATTDTFLLEFTSTQHWPTRLLGGDYPTGTLVLPLQIASQMTSSLRVSLTVPLDAGGTEVTIITATSQLSPTVRDIAVDTTIVPYKIYLPLVLKRWPPIPYQPTLSQIDNTDGDGVYMATWSPAELAQTYSLEEDDNAGFSSPTEVYKGTETSWSVPEPGKVAGTYYYRVRGYNVWGHGEYSDIQVATVLLPGTPTLSAIDNNDGDDNYNITWSTVARATSYTLQEDTNSAFSNSNYVYTGVQTSWSAIGKASGAYYYRVQASGPTGDSEWSNIQSVTITPPPSGVYILSNHSSYAHPYDGYSVVGEVWNNTSSYLRSIQASVKFYNSQGQLVDTISRYLPFDLAPGNKTCFSLNEWLDEINWDHYEFDPLSYRTDGAPHPQVTAINVYGYLDSSSDSYRVLGEIRNDHTTTVDYTKAQSTLYNTDGIVVDCWWQYANITTLAPGQTSSFELNSTWRAAGYIDVHSYRVEVEADEQ